MSAEPKHVLVVDDESTVRDLMHALLSHGGYCVETAESAAEALAKLARHEFDLVLTDFLMPGMNGVELAREIKKRRPALPIVLITGKQPESISTDISAVLAKPFSREDLCALVTSIT